MYLHSQNLQEKKRDIFKELRVKFVILQNIEAQIPTQNPEFKKKHRVYVNFFREVRANFSLLSWTRVRNTTEIVHKNSFR